ncbi:MAG: response regulator [Lachnospiraceae bacterium]|nr:response regulator [Lachnospiraceae bacterium]
MIRSIRTTLLMIICLACVFAGSFSHAYGTENTGENKPAAVDNSLIGGGYALSGQMPGIYYLPKLYDASNGLPTSEANAILCASNGYIYIGGYSGIIRYDGVNFERLPVADGLSSGRAFFEDRQARIWVATNDNGVVVMGNSESFHFTKKDGLPSNSIRTFARDYDSNVFVGTTAGVCYIDPAMRIHKISDDRIDSQRVLRLVSDGWGTIYGFTGNGTVFTVSTDGIKDYYESNDLGIGKITNILADPEKTGKVYFGTASGCVYYGDFGAQAVEMKKIDTAPVDNVHWLEYACGRLWVASTKILGYVDEKDRFVSFDNFTVKDAIEMMTVDYQGNIWVASSRYGVMKIVADNFLDISDTAGLPEEVVNTTCMRNGELYIGTDNGLYVVDGDHNEIKNDLTTYFNKARIRCIKNDSEGNTWFCTFTGGYGLVCVDKNGRIKVFNTGNGMPSNEVRCITERKEGGIIAGTNGGIVIIEHGKIEKVYGTKSGLHNTVTLTVCEGYAGEILAGTDGDGLYIIENDKVRRIGTDEGLSSDVIMRLEQDKERELIWVITSNAVEYMKNGMITNVTTFPYNNNFDVIYGSNNDLWFLSSRGIYVVDATEAVENRISSYKLFNKENGLTRIPVSHCYSCLDDDGNLYVAGQNGVSVVNALNFVDFSGRAIVGLKSVLFDGENILPDESGKFELPPKYGRLQITPAVLDYTISDPIINMYLEELNDQGISVNQSRLTALEYTGLKYGTYTLRIVVRDSRTNEITAEKNYTLIKKPLPFERQSVRIALLLVLLAAIGIAVWRIMNGTVIKNQYLQIQEARDEAEKANQAKSRFLANMSHEIRTPINTIMGMDEMILREDVKNAPREYYAPVVGYARNIKYASESLLSLINDLLDISKIESGKMHLVEQEYDTKEMLLGITTMIRGRAEDKKLYFDLDIDESLPKRLYGDGVKIKQIILNLLTNAVKYTEDGGFTLSVAVTSRNEAGVTLQISVKDTGIGVKKEDLEKLFSAYERLDEVKNSNIQGTGLGLDISRQFAELMGGRLWCESIYGEGSEFLLVIKQKIVDETPIGVFIEEAAEDKKGGYKPQFVAPDADILVVDDNPMNLNVIKGLLKPTKVFVTTADSGEEALAKIEDNDFNVVLLDHMMPGMDGIETLEKIREKHPDLPVYALTANATAGGEEFYKSKGFDGYLTKPIDIVAVEHAIMRHLPENIMMTASDDDVAADDTAIPDDMLWVNDVSEISVQEGITNSGGASSFVFALKMFFDSIDDNHAVIKKAYESGDLKLATVKVHALKSSARIIGAMELSSDCQALEDAGNKKDMDYINANKDRVLDRYLSFKETLKKLDENAESDEGKEEMSPSDLADAYSALKDCIGQMDYDSVEMIVKQVMEYKLPKEDEELMKEFEKSLKNVDWDKMEELVAKR